MNEDRLIDLIGQVDEKYIEEATVKEIPIGKFLWTKWLGIAAGIILAVGIGVGVLQSGIIGNKSEQTAGDKRWPDKIIYVDSEEQGDNELAIVPKWDEMNISQQYTEFQYNSNRYSTRDSEIASDNIGDKIAEVSMQGYDIYTDTTYHTNAFVYTINNILSECAVAVQFEGGTDYYVYVNSWYRPDTLGEFIEALNLDENISFGSVWYQYLDSTIEFVDIDEQIVWDMLLDDTTLKNEYDQNNMYISEMSISVDIPLLGYENISLAVTSDGYLTTNILNTGKAFYIGKEKVEKFVDYIVENCEGYEIIYKYEDNIIEEDMEMTINNEKSEIYEESTSQSFQP